VPELGPTAGNGVQRLANRAPNFRFRNRKRQSLRLKRSTAREQSFAIRAPNFTNLGPGCCFGRQSLLRPLAEHSIIHRRKAMNWDAIKADWKDLKGRARVQWAKLTDSDLAGIRGNREQLEAAVEKRYGVAKAEAQRQVDAWVKALKRRIEGKRTGARSA
jgi:uncharacterized protein YjbJ (UPF0337 family)